MSDIVKYQQHDAVAVITLHRPEAMNSFNTELRAALAFALEKAHEDDSVRVVILTGEGRTFSAGADLKAGIDRDVSEILQVEYRPVQEAIAKMAKPVIAAIPGSAGIRPKVYNRVIAVVAGNLAYNRQCLGSDAKYEQNHRHQRQQAPGIYQVRNFHGATSNFCITRVPRPDYAALHTLLQEKEQVLCQKRHRH